MVSLIESLPPDLQYGSIITKRGKGFGIAVGFTTEVKLSDLVGELEAVVHQLKSKPEYKDTGN